jgi:uncharacterized lipoprotein YmbA
MVRLILAVILVLSVASCGTSPKTHFYTLTPVPPAQGTQPAALSGPPLQVGNVALPGALDRQSIVTRGPGARVIVSDQNRWAAPLDELTRRALTADLRDRLGSKHVMGPGEPAPPGGVRLLILNVQQFSADTAGTVVLETDWTISTGRPPKAGRSRHEVIKAQASPEHAETVAAAMSQALGELADRIARELTSRRAAVERVKGIEPSYADLSRDLKISQR